MPIWKLLQSLNSDSPFPGGWGKSNNQTILSWIKISILFVFFIFSQSKSTFWCGQRGTINGCDAPEWFSSWVEAMKRRERSVILFHELREVGRVIADWVRSLHLDPLWKKPIRPWSTQGLRGLARIHRAVILGSYGKGLAIHKEWFFSERSRWSIFNYAGIFSSPCIS